MRRDIIHISRKRDPVIQSLLRDQLRKLCAKRPLTVDDKPHRRILLGDLGKGMDQHGVVLVLVEPSRRYDQILPLIRYVPV